jgi:tetratricopeptide (TPR) repeat protein
MPIDWLESETAIDTRRALEARRDKLEATLAVNPRDPDAALKLLAVLDQLGVPPQEMAARVEAALRANPGESSLLAWLGQFAWRSGEAKLAMLTLKQAIATDKGEPLANFSLAQILYAAGAYKDAERHARIAFENGRASHLADQMRRLYAVVLSRLRRHEEAYALVLERLSETPEDTQALLDAHDLLRELKRGEDARRLIEQAAGKQPRNTDLLFRLAVAAFEDGELAAARNWADRLIEADAQHLEGWHLRSRIRQKQGDFEGALADAAMLPELSRTIPVDYAFTAECLIALGRKEEATTALEQGLGEGRAPAEEQRRYEKMLRRLRGS